MPDEKSWGWGGGVAIMHRPGWATGEEVTGEENPSPLHPSSLLPKTHPSAHPGREAAAMLEAMQGG